MGLGTVLRGVLAGIAGLGFILTFMLAQTRLVSPLMLIGVGVASIAALLGAGGRKAMLRLVGHREIPDTGKSSDTDWWLTRVEPALESSWNSWSDLILAIGLAGISVAAFALLIHSPRDNPPLGLLIVGFLGLNGALFSLAFVFK
jgi:hypothetical protein